MSTKVVDLIHCLTTTPHSHHTNPGQDPMKFKIPVWFLNRQHDPVHGKFQQVHAQGLAGTLRDDLERLKKIRSVRSSLLSSVDRWISRGL